MAIEVKAIAFSYVTHVLGIAAAFLVLVLVWTIHFRGGLAWEDSNKSLIFNVSKLLAVQCALSTSNMEIAALISSRTVLTGSHWASYFHQASIGNQFSHELLSQCEKKRIKNSMDVVCSFYSSSTSCKSIRFAPEFLADLEEFILKFFEELPHNIICISMLEEAYASLFCKQAPNVCAWIMLSRMNSNGQPVSVILQVDSIIEVKSKSTTVQSGGTYKFFPTIIQDLVPEFKDILEEDTHILRTTRQWDQRKKLNHRLDEFLRDLEKLWFGPWECLFSDREWRPDSSQLRTALMRLKESVEPNDIDDSILEVIIKSSTIEECLSQLISRKKCYVAGSGSCKFSATSMCSPGDLLQVIKETKMNSHSSEEPVILVLDYNVQVLPWENIPSLRKQDVYRMPSVASIFYAHEKNSEVPMIDPANAYYLVNPTSDLRDFEDLLKDRFKNLKGKMGMQPNKKEMIEAVSKHNLFLYFGHNDGRQYIPYHVFSEHDKLAAAFLMGCKSGCLSALGSNAPTGVPLDYLRGGSPFVVANLWNVSGKEIVRFANPILDHWFEEETKSDHGIASLVRRARGSAKLECLTGAAVVCYGVPTRIKKSRIGYDSPMTEE